MNPENDAKDVSGKDQPTAPARPAPPVLRHDDRRRFHRVPFNAPIILDQEGREFQTEILDISLRGILLERPDSDHPMEEGGLYGLRLALSDNDVLHMKARLVHIEISKLGFEYEALDLDSATLLRRLVELNLADAALFERDLQALVNTAG